MNRKFKEFLMIRVAPAPAALLLRLLRATVRIGFLHREIPDSLRARNQRYIMAFWHGTLLLMIYAYLGQALTFLVSWHRDGELVSRVMDRFGVKPIRGSTTRGGMRALQEILKRVKEGYDVAFTPDGPKGPARKAQLGVVQAARLASIPIVPVGFAARRRKCLKSWDSFQVPLPFTRVAFCFGSPIEIPRRANGEELEMLRASVEAGLEAATSEAEEAVNRRGPWRA